MGSVPPAPAWFEQAMAHAPQERSLSVNGGTIETLIWGDEGLPGILLLHGSAAHASVWRPIAPLLAQGRRVVAMSWPGMGGSSWRPSYNLSDFADDLMSVAEQTGLFACGEKPMMVAHSLAGGPAALAAYRNGDRFRGVVLVDSGFRAPTDDHRVFSEVRPHRIYPTLEDALARFRFAPTQPTVNAFIADMIARRSLMRSGSGWTWQFDPALWRRLRLSIVWSELAAPRCPIAIISGEHSTVTHGLMGKIMAHVPAGTPHVVIPDAHHHLMVDQPLAFVAVLRTMLASWAP
jgi:pimeloyl-ACP methyl ester carboxylesterase